MQIHDMVILQDKDILQDMEIILHMEIVLHMEAKHHALLHRTTISRRKQIYCQAYNLYAYILN